MISISHIDHIVLTVHSIEATCDFYSQVLGMECIEFSEGRKALKFGNQKINLHLKGKEFKPHASHPKSGSADICFITDCPIKDVVSSLTAASIQIECGPIGRTGAEGKIESVYIRDPDGNLLEISNYLTV